MSSRLCSRPFWFSGVPRAKLLAVLVTVALSSICALSQVRSDHGHFNKKGNILISDQFNNRVIEVRPSGEIIWQFGLGPNDFSANSILGVNDAQRVGDLTLVAGTGIPAGVDSDNDGRCRGQPGDARRSAG